MNAIQTLAQSIETATLSVSREKGIAAATQWVSVLTPILVAYPIATTNMQDWLSQGSSTSKTSGVNYKSSHNKGIFPAEQVFCNTRAKAKRPLSTVCKAIATALVENVAYNPDRFSNAVSVTGMEQGLTQHNRTVESLEKREIMELVATKPLNAKVKKELIKESAAMDTARKQNLGAVAFEASQSLAMIIAKYSKKPETVKPETIKPASGRKPRAA
jgi:hypothetical protein